MLAEQTIPKMYLVFQFLDPEFVWKWRRHRCLWFCYFWTLSMDLLSSFLQNLCKLLRIMSVSNFWILMAEMDKPNEFIRFLVSFRTKNDFEKRIGLFQSCQASKLIFTVSRNSFGIGIHFFWKKCSPFSWWFVFRWHFLWYLF